MEKHLKPQIVVVGGINMDIGGSPSGKLVLRDSCPGHVMLRPGGVGRNIAHNLCTLGAQVSLIGALGQDVYGAGLRESCREIGLDLSMALTVPEGRSSTYLYVTDEQGDMELAISDMDIVDQITPEYVAGHMERINSAHALVVDANLPEETLEYLVANSTVPVYADPVSTAKAPKLRQLLKGLRLLKPNAIEAQTLSGCDSPEQAAQRLLETGLEKLYISLGVGGMLAADRQQMLRLPAVGAKVLNTTGAGDAAMAALVWADVQGMGLEESARLAMRAGAMTTQCPQPNHPRLYEIFE